MKRTITILIISFITTQVWAQIGGLSASKLSAYNTSPVQTRKAEIEPSFYTYLLKDSLNRPYFDRASLLRFTYGFNDNLEAGFITDLGINLLQLGSKYKFFDNDKLSMGLMGGINFDFSQKKMPLYSLAGGLICSYNFKPGFSLDANLTLDKNFFDNSIDGSFVADIGYYFGIFQPILELSYSNNYYLKLKKFKDLFSATLGFTFEPGENYLIVVGVPYFFNHRRNTEITGVSVAITITLN